MSDYQNKPPAQRRELNQSGMVTNARQEHPNGMPFTKPDVELYFTDMQDEHHREEDRFKETTAGGLVFPGDQEDWQQSWERRQRVEHARFLHRPTAGGGK